MYFAATIALFLGAASSALALPTPNVSTVAAAAAKVLVKVDLPAPNNWLTASRLYPSNVIAAYNAELAAYDAESWNAHILEKCQGFRDCTSTASYQAPEDATGSERFTVVARPPRPTTSEFLTLRSVSPTPRCTPSRPRWLPRWRGGSTISVSELMAVFSFFPFDAMGAAPCRRVGT
ncbi:hypothetical protein RB601_002179 [Gaeumannomyces tritici]